MTVDSELFGDTLPTYLTRFIGRDVEIRAVQSFRQLLSVRAHELVARELLAQGLA